MIDEIIAQEREGFIASVEHKERPTCDLEDDLWEEKFYDENSGKELPPEGVKNARMEEIEVIKSMGVWEPIDRPTGEKVIGTRWVDINKGDSLHMKLRSRGRKETTRILRGPTSSQPCHRIIMLRRFSP